MLRLRLRPILAALLLGLPLSALAQKLISEGDTWKYFKGTVFPAAQGATNWYQAGYTEDANWLGPAASGFGYGDGDDGTTLSDMLNGYLTIYTRKSVSIADPAAITYLTLSVDYDDGFVAFLNGTEIARRNVPAGQTNSTAANALHEASHGTGSGTPQEREYFPINPALLVAGANLLAVEVHNQALTSSDVSLSVELSRGVNLLRGPYVQMPVAGAMTIVWRTDAVTDSAVDYGFDTSYALGTISSAGLVTEHVVSIPNLLPNKDYYYRVRSGGATLSAGKFFRSVRSVDQPFRFCVIGDFGGGSSNTTSVANRIAASNGDLLLTVGDNIYEWNGFGGNGTGQPGNYDPYWFTPFAAAMGRMPTFPAMGNHEYETETGAWIPRYFWLPQNGPAGLLERNYSFDYGNAHFAVIDVNPFVNPQNGVINTTQQAAIKTWLANDLAATAQRWKFVFWHQPAYSSSGNGTHDPETLLQTDIAPICEQNGVQMIFQGHNHWYERINPINGVNYFVTGAGGKSLTSPNVFPTYSALLKNAVYSFTQVDVASGVLTLRQIDASGAQIDFFTLDLDHPFKMDGLLDSASYQRAVNGLKLYAAIRGNVLYLATQDAGEGNDHFIYLANTPGPLKTANWSKAGQVMTWSAFLGDENDSGFAGWFDGTEQTLNDPAKYRAVTSGLNNNGAAGNGVLEGTINLVGHFGSFPQQLYVAVAPFATANGGALVSSAQVPAGNGDGSIPANEFLLLNPRDIALDVPVSNAGNDQSVEAGMLVTLNGSGSNSPAGLPLSFAWTQLSGPGQTLTNSNQVISTFSAGSNVAQNTNVTFRLRVNDTRFDTDDSITVTLFPMIDSDGDGLSDQEELTGKDNVLTPANPAGRITNPSVADSDGDGTNDGNEALAGTDPNDASSSFHVVSAKSLPEGFQIQWSSVVGKVYQVQSSGDLNAWTDLDSPVTASATTTTHLDANPPVGRRFYRVLLVL